MSVHSDGLSRAPSRTSVHRDVQPYVVSGSAAQTVDELRVSFSGRFGACSGAADILC